MAAPSAARLFPYPTAWRQENHRVTDGSKQTSGHVHPEYQGIVNIVPNISGFTNSVF